MVSKMKQTNIRRDDRVFKVTNILIESESGAMRFKDIWGKVKGSPLFKSTRDLADTLRFLVNKKEYIRKCTISRKNVIYVLALDTKGMKALKEIKNVNLNLKFTPLVFNQQYTVKVTNELKKEYDEREEMYPLLLQAIDHSVSTMTPSETASFFESIWYQMLKGYLIILEHWVRAPECLDDVVKRLMIERVLERDYELLAKMGKTFPNGTDKCLQNIKDKFDLLTKDAFVGAGLKAE
jgi:hypothetical protein